MVMSPILAVEVDQAVFYRLDVFVESLEMGTLFSAAAVSQGGEAEVAPEGGHGTAPVLELILSWRWSWQSA